MSTYEYNFTIENIKREEADRILDLIVVMAERLGGMVGGGFNKQEGKDDAQEKT